MATQSSSPTTGVSSSSAPTIAQILTTTRNPEVWQHYNLCKMTDNSTKAQCKHCFNFLSSGSNSTLRNHITHPHCEALKTVPEAGQSSMARDGSVFVYNPDVLREQFAGLVIQQGLPFNHLDNAQMTRVFQNHMQPKYNQLKEKSNKRERNDRLASSEYERYANEDFISHLKPQEFAGFDVLGFWKAKESMFPVLSRMAMDLISVQATSVASEFTFSTSERVLSIRRTRLTPTSLKMYFEEEILDKDVQENEVMPLSDEEIALDEAASEARSNGSGFGAKEIDMILSD
ncbi:zinc finger BED domain-containing protein RICESLEEPER 2 [Tanacetum coccineum]